MSLFFFGLLLMCGLSYNVPKWKFVSEEKESQMENGFIMHRQGEILTKIAPLNESSEKAHVVAVFSENDGKEKYTITIPKYNNVIHFFGITANTILFTEYSEIYGVFDCIIIHNVDIRKLPLKRLNIKTTHPSLSISTNGQYFSHLNEMDDTILEVYDISNADDIKRIFFRNETREEDWTSYTIGIVSEGIVGNYGLYEHCDPSPFGPVCHARSYVTFYDFINGKTIWNFKDDVQMMKRAPIISPNGLYVGLVFENLARMDHGYLLMFKYSDVDHTYTLHSQRTFEEDIDKWITLDELAIDDKGNQYIAWKYHVKSEKHYVMEKRSPQNKTVWKIKGIVNEIPREGNGMIFSKEQEFVAVLFDYEVGGIPSGISLGSIVRVYDVETGDVVFEYKYDGYCNTFDFYFDKDSNEIRISLFGRTTKKPTHKPEIDGNASVLYFQSKPTPT